MSDANDIFMEYVKNYAGRHSSARFVASSTKEMQLVFAKSNFYVQWQLNSSGDHESVMAILSLQEKIISAAEIALGQPRKSQIQLELWKANYLNNMGILAIHMSEYMLALKSLKSASQQIEGFKAEDDQQLLFSVIHNNLSVTLIQFGLLEEAELAIQKSVQRAELIVFRQINQQPTYQLKGQQRFLQQLQILVYGYLYFDMILSQLRATKRDRTPRSEQDSSPAESESSFLKNAVIMSQKFLGDSHPLTSKVQCYRYKIGEQRLYDALTPQFSFCKDHVRIWQMFQKYKLASDETEVRSSPQQKINGKLYTDTDLQVKPGGKKLCPDNQLSPKDAPYREQRQQVPQKQLIPLNQNVRQSSQASEQTRNGGGTTKKGTLNSGQKGRDSANTIESELNLEPVEDAVVPIRELKESIDQVKSEIQGIKQHIDQTIARKKQGSSQEIIQPETPELIVSAMQGRRGLKLAEGRALADSKALAEGRAPAEGRALADSRAPAENEISKKIEQLEEIIRTRNNSNQQKDVAELKNMMNSMMNSQLQLEQKFNKLSQIQTISGSGSRSQRSTRKLTKIEQNEVSKLGDVLNIASRY